MRLRHDSLLVEDGVEEEHQAGPRRSMPGHGTATLQQYKNSL